MGYYKCHRLHSFYNYTVQRNTLQGRQATPGKAVPLGWLVILQKSVLQKHPHSSSFFGHYGRTCFTADERAFKKKLKKSFENYLNARVNRLGGCCRTRSPPVHFLMTPLWSSLGGCSGHHHSSEESFCPKAALQHSLLEHCTLLRTPTHPGTQAGPALCQ